jgi:hypothetical protein
MAWNRKERRLKRRYEIPLGLRYTLPAKISAGGTGELKNISSSGLMFHSDERVPVGAPIVVEIDWPGPASSGDQVSIVVAGHVVRSRRHCLAVAINSHCFRRQASSRAPSSAEIDGRSETILLVSERCEFFEATLPEPRIGVLRMTTAAALEVLRAGQVPVALVIADRVGEFAEFNGRVHIAGIGTPAATTRAAV